MDGAAVDDFGARLARELSAMDWRSRNDLLIRIGREDLRMRAAGQERPIWQGPIPEARILGADVVIPTEQGERRGRVVCFGVLPSNGQWERSVVIHVPASGTHHEGPGSQARLASPEESERIQNEVAMASRLAEASYAAQRGPARPDEALRLQRKRGLRDPKLIQEMLELARTSPNVVDVVDGAANHKLVGKHPSRRIYVFKTQLRVDLSGFSFDHPAVERVTDEQARDLHLGKVRGHLIFDDREQALDAFRTAIDQLAAVV